MSIFQCLIVMVFQAKGRFCKYLKFGTWQQKLEETSASKSFVVDIMRLLFNKTEVYHSNPMNVEQ